MSIARDAVRGALAGAAATWLMDLVTTRIYEGQPPAVNEREVAAQPNGKSSVANLVDRIESVTGFKIPRARRPLAENVVHYGLGAVPGAIYGVLRRHVPIARAGEGSAFGLALFAVNDELLNTKLGLAGPMSAYPARTHLRGLAGHAALGIGTETGIQLLGG